MDKELISDKQGIALVTLFILGSTIILGTSLEAKRDSWLALLLAMVLVVPFLLVYARLASLYPGKNLFQTLDQLLGKVGGRLIGVIYIIYSFHLGALVTTNFSEFMITVGLRETPRSIPTLVLILLCIWALKEGLEVLGRWSFLSLPVLVAFIVLTTFFLAPQLNLNNLRPVLEFGSSRLLTGAFLSFSFPFAETVIVILAVNSFKNKASPYKIYLISLPAAGIILFIITVRNLLVVGPNLLSEAYFPSYIVSRRIDVTDFIQRLEILVAVVFIFAGFTKISLCILGACRGIAHILGIKDYRSIVTPVALLMLDFSFILFENAMEMRNWVNIYKYYAFPFQVVLPVIILIIAEIRIRQGNERKGKAVSGRQETAGSDNNGAATSVDK